MDLLHAPGAAIRVSTVYEGRTEQIGHLFDGRPETAWNSATDDLVGAYIDLRVPEAARVSSIEMTVGYDKRAQTDLFTGNHRISKVRVAREGQVLGSFELDPSVRELQPLPVSGPGGVYRIEVLEVVPGSRADWREVCVSELRVVGTLDAAVRDDAVPDVGVGALPGARIDEEPVETTEGDQETDEDDGGAPGPPELEGVTLVIPPLRDLDIEEGERTSIGRGRRGIHYTPVTHPDRSVSTQLDRRMRADALATVEALSPARFGLEVDAECSPLLLSDHLISVVCVVSEYEDAGDTESVGAFLLELRGGRVRRVELADLFASTFDLEALLQERVPASVRSRYMSCRGGGCRDYVAVAAEEGIALVDTAGGAFHTIPYASLREHLSGDGTLAALFLLAEEPE